MKNEFSKFTLIFDAILVSTCLHFDTENPTNTQKEPSQEASTKMIDFGIDLLAILALFRNPSWDPRRLQNTSKTPQDAPGTTPRRLEASGQARRRVLKPSPGAWYAVSSLHMSMRWCISRGSPLDTERVTGDCLHIKTLRRAYGPGPWCATSLLPTNSYVHPI